MKSKPLTTETVPSQMFLQLAEALLNQHFFIWVNINPKTDEEQAPTTGTVPSQMVVQLAEALLNQRIFYWVNTNPKTDEEQAPYHRDSAQPDVSAAG